MSVTQEELSGLLGRLQAAELELERRQEGAEKENFKRQIADLKVRIAAALPDDPARPGLDAAALPVDVAAEPAGAEDDDEDALAAIGVPQEELDAIKKAGEGLLAKINPYATTIEGTKADASIPDSSREVTATTGDTLTIKYIKGKASISIPSTDSMVLAQKIQLARNMTYFALKTGAYETDENGNITFIIRSPDIQLRTALEETVKSLGFKFKTPDFSNAARRQAHSAAADQTGFLSPISGIYTMNSVARTAAKIASIIKNLNLESSIQYQNKLQAVKENSILQDTLASVTDISLSKKRIKREKTSDEILEQLQNNSHPLYQKVKQDLDTHIATLPPPPTEDAKLTKLHEIINGLISKNSTAIEIIDQLLQNPKQEEIMGRSGFLQEFEQGASTYPKEQREIAIERFKRNTIAGQVFRSKQTGEQAELLFATRSKSPANNGKLDAMAKDGVGKANEFLEQIKPDDIKTATAYPKAMAKHLTDTGKASHAAQPKQSTPPSSSAAPSA